MSKKNLARSAIEGGRYNHNKWERYNSNTEERATTREYLSNVKKDEGYADEVMIAPRKHVSKDFRDKLSPMYRWLHSEVGNKWDDVKSKVFSTFDTRTTAGRHITFDHLLSSVEEVPNLDYKTTPYTEADFTTSRWSENSFYVDDDGILRNKKYIPREKKPKFDTGRITNWLNGRVVGRVGNKFFWFMPAHSSKKWRREKKQWKCVWGYASGSHMHYGLHFKKLEEYIYHKYDNGKLVYEDGKLIVIGHEYIWKYGIPVLRQDRQLNEKEIGFWNKLPEEYQTRILEHSPTWTESSLKKRYYY